MAKKTTAPKHLEPATRRWWQSVVNDFVLEEHHRMTLTAAAEAWDRKEAARRAVEENGLTYTDRFNAPRLRPEANVQRDCEMNFSKLIRELALDAGTPEEPRPPRIAGRVYR